MNIVLILYLIDFLTNLAMASTIFMIILGIALLVIGVVYMATRYDNFLDEKESTLLLLKRWGKRIFIGFIIFLLIALIIPSERTLYLMLFLNKGQKIEQTLNGKYGKRIENIINLELNNLQNKLTKEVNNEQ